MIPNPTMPLTRIERAKFTVLLHSVCADPSEHGIPASQPNSHDQRSPSVRRDASLRGPRSAALRGLRKPNLEGM